MTELPELWWWVMGDGAKVGATGAPSLRAPVRAGGP